MSRTFLASFLCVCCLAQIAWGQATEADEYSAMMARMMAEEAQLHAQAMARAKLPDPASGYRWQDAAKKVLWSQKDIDAIERDKFRFTDQPLRQVFQAYNGGDFPPFVTSDSVLNAYNVLLEDSVRRMESANSRKLRPILGSIFDQLATVDKNITGKPETSAAAKRRAQMTIAVALQLLGDDSLKLDPAMAPLVDEQIKKVIAAKGMEMPVWLGKPSPDFAGIDYARFTVRGFYTRTPQLQGYFRAVAWLQAIPFHIDNDEEFLSALMIGSAASIDMTQPIGDLFWTYDLMLGKPDDLGIDAISEFCIGGLDVDLGNGDLAARRGRLPEFVRVMDQEAQVHDLLRLWNNSAKTIRVVPARLTPDSAMFDKILNNSVYPLPPSGWDVAAALGSQYAMKKLTVPPPKDPPLVDVNAVGKGTLYNDYLNCIQSLNDPPEKDAPPMFSSPIWQAKQCQTVLGAWAQLRHTWQLQAKEPVAVFGGIEPHPPGFVEPVPEFFSRLAALSQRMAEVVHNADGDGLDIAKIGGQVKELTDLLQKADIGKDGTPHPHPLTYEECLTFDDLLSAANPDAAHDAKYLNSPIGRTNALASLFSLSAELNKGAVPADARELTRLRTISGIDPAEGWQKLMTICLQLDALANKELRGADFNDSEKRFLRDYGLQLSSAMLFEPDDALTPPDTAARIADVYRDPTPGKSYFFEVGIGRPRMMYLLYPYHGGEVLCEGAVMPYYEFRHDTPMTDSQWTDMLDSKSPPKPLISGGN